MCIGGGYQSWSEVWEASKRFESRKNQEIIILYFGDLDPSGKDMPRDIQERFNTVKTPVTVKEIALSKKDIVQYSLPKNPMKEGDTRSTWYTKKHGINYGVELDALPPDVLKEKTRKAIKKRIIKPALFVQRREKDEKDREKWMSALEEV